MKHHKIAFTLAEVLITLGIIGVVAAMTMPVLIGNYQKKQTVTQLKKAYSVLNQALKLSEVDNGEFENWEDPLDIGHIDYLNRYWVPYFNNVVMICDTYEKCGYKENFPWTGTDGRKYAITAAAKDYRIPFITGDGIMYIISIRSGNSSSSEIQKSSSIYIDINGAKGPNVVGKDFFVFTRADGRIMPACYNDSKSAVDKICSRASDGSCCAAKIMADGWQILDDYPW